MLGDDGSVIQSDNAYPTALLAPYSPHSPNYTITAKIEATDFNSGATSAGCGGNAHAGFGIAARVQQGANAQSGYWAGIRFYDHNNTACAKPWAAIAAVSNGNISGGNNGPFTGGPVSSVFTGTPDLNVFDGQVHIYQLKVDGIHFVLSIDGHMIAKGDDPSIEQAGQVGVWSAGVKIAVLDFKVVEQVSTPDKYNWHAWLAEAPKTSDWRRIGGVLGDDGSVIQSDNAYPTALLAPYSPHSPNYTITAKIEATDFNSGATSAGCGGNAHAGFGIAARVQQGANAQSGYWAGIRFYDHNNTACAEPWAAIAAVSNGNISGGNNGPFTGGPVSSVFTGTPDLNVFDGQVHIYQLKVDGIHFVLSIDGHMIAKGDDPSIEQAGQVGVWSAGVKIAVLDFKVR